MLSAALELSAAADQVAVVDGPGDLAAVEQLGVNLAIWPRRLGAGLERYARALTDRARFSVDAVVVASRREALLAKLDAALPAWARRHEAFEVLVDDAHALVARYAALTGSPLVRVQLGVIDHDGCRLFHVDYIGLRLVTTYSGAGTHWLRNRDVVRAALQTTTPDARNAAVLPDARRRRALSAGHVAIMKGESFPGNAGNGLIHRSPPLTDGGRPRLRLVVDVAHHDPIAGVC
jgi:hypothetical protein